MEESHTMEQLTERRWYAMRATYGRNMQAKQIADAIGVSVYIPMRYAITRGGGGGFARECLSYGI